MTSSQLGLVLETATYTLHQEGKIRARLHAKSIFALRLLTVGWLVAQGFLVMALNLDGAVATTPILVMWPLVAVATAIPVVLLALALRVPDGVGVDPHELVAPDGRPAEIPAVIDAHAAALDRLRARNKQVALWLGRSEPLTLVASVLIVAQIVGCVLVTLAS